ncbi:MAG: dTDP-4-dehydrorhamnose 3,5-epimerase [Nitrospirae bacterium]|nr:dTDP-4-dehydrorhamnose 3,5-epimerase [Nitrospirota bacterium]
MPLKFTETALPGLIIIETETLKDSRGFFMETFHQKKYADIGISRPFVQDNFSRSCKGTLRGLHYQLNHPQAKLVYVTTGEIYDVALDIRRGSPTFGKWAGVYLSSENGRQLFIPEGFAHGFCVLSETADFIYKCTDLYHQGDDHGILWSDPELNIDWPVKDPLLSTKDSRQLPLKDMPQELLPLYKK